MNAPAIKLSIGRTDGQEFKDRQNSIFRSNADETKGNQISNSFTTKTGELYGENFIKSLGSNNFGDLDFQSTLFTSGTKTTDARTEGYQVDAANYKKNNSDAEALIAKEAVDKAWLGANAVSFVTAGGYDAQDLITQANLNINDKENINDNKPNEELDQLNSLANQFGMNINQEFLQEYNSMGGSYGAINSGSRDTERSFNPLNIIAEDKEGFRIRSLNSFFKKGDIQDSGLRSYAQNLGDYNWATMSRAMGELLSNAYTEQGLSKDQILSQTSTQMALAAKLFEGTRFEKNSQAMTFMLSNLVLNNDVFKNLDQSALQNLGFNEEQIKGIQNGDKVNLARYENDQGVLLGEALRYSPSMLENNSIYSSLKSSLYENSQAASLDHFTEEVKAGSLNNIYEDMHRLLQSDRYADEITKLQDAGIETNREAVDALMGELGFSAGGSEYLKVNNADAVAQTFLNYAALKHDHQLQQAGNLNDDNRLFSPDAQLMVRMTPDNGEDHNGAFNEKNLGRDLASVMGLNNEQIAQFIVAAGDDATQIKFFNMVSETVGDKISNVDYSKHGYENGAGNLGSNDVQLISAIERAMAAGGEIVLNSCSCASGTDKGGTNNVAGATLKKMAEDKGLKLHAATVSTMGYTEHTGFDVGSGQAFMTPVKLDGATGGVTIEAPDPEKLASNRGLKLAHHSHYINAQEDQTSPESRRSETTSFNFASYNSEAGQSELVEQEQDDKKTEFSFS